MNITESDFQTWKHHPVTKWYLQFLKNYEGQVERAILGGLRGHAAAPDAYSLGRTVGYANAIRDMGEPQYASVIEFYASPEEDQQQQEDRNAA